jgi:chemotaxis signal transduction protein
MKTSRTELPSAESQPIKFIVFAIAEYHLALPFEYIVQVINYPAQVNPEINKLGLIHLGSHTIRLVNFSQQFPLPESLPESSQLSRTPLFLVIARDLQGAICGIPVDQPPDLIEIPAERMQLLPQSDRYPMAIQAASHVAIVSQGKDVTTIFLLKGIDG